MGFSNVCEKPIGKRFARIHGHSNNKASRALHKRINRRDSRRYIKALVIEANTFLYPASVGLDWEHSIKLTAFAYR